MKKLVKLQRTIGFNQLKKICEIKARQFLRVVLSITNSREMATRQFIKRNFCEKTCQIAKDNFLAQSAVEKNPRNQSVSILTTRFGNKSFVSGYILAYKSGSLDKN